MRTRFIVKRVGGKEAADKREFRKEADARAFAKEQNARWILLAKTKLTQTILAVYAFGRIVWENQ